MKRWALLLLLSAVVTPVSANAASHVNWTLEFEPAAAKPGAKIVARLKAKIDPGWHLYSLSTPPPPIATTITLAPNNIFGATRALQPKPIRKHDPNFDVDTETFEGEAVFLLEATVKPDAPAGAAEITAQPRYQVCSDTSCIPPKTQPVSAQFQVDPATTSTAPSIPPGYSEPKPTGSATSSSSDSLLGFLAIAFGFGIAAIFTPCVFPMIPITMSFFLNQENATRRQTIFQAGLFCSGIIVLFTALGLTVTALLGPFGVVRLGSNPWVNGLICAVFLIFGLSLLGAFEITIPSAILTRLDSASRGGGTAGTLLMGLTFSLSSFACVGPFMGPLLAAAAQGGGARPAMGMVLFAAGLSLPFFLLALFPAYLKKLPRSGGWLARVKVVMGFVILAAMLKYLSAIDQVLGGGFLTRERFLAAWIVLFAMAGLYLLGFLRMEGVSKDEPTGLGRLLAGMALLIFAISLVPGMNGRPLGDLDAYVPASDNVTAPGAPSEPLLKNDLAGALAKAKAEGKRVLVTFTGYACTNCHWMKANIFTKPEIAGLLKDFVQVELYTDGTDAASQEFQKLEESKFGTVAIPFYVVYDADQNVIATFPQLTRNPKEFAAFLNTSPSAKPAAALASTSSSSEFEGLPLTTLEGAPFDRAALKGKVVVVDFWATWCVPCRQEIPGFNKLSGKGINVVGVSMDEDGAALVKQFMKEHPMKYPVALGAQQINDQLKIGQLPITVIYDRNGKAVQRFEGLTSAETIERAALSAAQS